MEPDEHTSIFERILGGANRFPLFARMRRECPVLRVEQGWHFFLYEDVLNSLREPDVFSSDPSHAPAWWKTLYPQLSGGVSMVLADGEAHRRLRRPLQRFFWENLDERLEAPIRRITCKAIERADAERGFEVGEVFGTVPIELSEELLGVSLDLETSRHWGRFGAQAISITSEDARGELGRVDRDMLNVAEVTRHEIATFVARLVNERSCAESRDDLISELLGWEQRGLLDRIETESICTTLVLAAGQAIHEGIYNTVYALTAHAELVPRLRHDPSLIPRFIHETLRLYTPSQHVTRVTTQPVSLRGQSIPRGEIVNLWLSSANRDESVFANPENFDMTRPPDAHLAFGAGPHYCLGAALTVLELRVIVDELLLRLKSIELVGEPVQWLNSLMAFRPERLVVKAMG